MIEDVKNFVTLAEAAAYLGVSERTIRRRIDSNELEAQKIDGKLMVCLPDAAKSGQNVDIPVTEVDKIKDDIQGLYQQLREIEGAIRQLEARLNIYSHQLAEYRGRLETINAFIAYSQQSFWRKLFSRKQLPPAVVDMEDKDGKR